MTEREQSELMASAIRLVRSGRHREAVDLVSPLANHHDGTYDCHFVLGEALVGLEEFEAGINELIRAVHVASSETEHLRAMYEIADAYHRFASPKQALYYFRAVLDRAPEHDDPRGSAFVRVRRLMPSTPPDELA